MTAGSAKADPQGNGGVCRGASKAVADAVTEYACDEDGFGRYFEDHWFNR